MTVREWLNRGWKLNIEINMLLEEKNEVFSLACQMTTNSQNEKVQTSHQNVGENKWIHYIEYENLVNARIDELYAIKKEILEAINQVDNSVYRALLINRYIQFKTWQQIALLLDYDYYHVIKYLHPKALKMVKLPANTTSIYDIV